MSLTEFNEKVFVDGIREEGREEGLAKGREEGLAEGKIKGQLNTLISLVKDNLLDISIAAERCGMTVEEFQKRL